jgi:hypothetical protein
MNAKLHPVTFELPDQLIAELTITAHASESQALAEAAKTLTALETEKNEDDTAFDAETFECEFAQAEMKISINPY